MANPREINKLSLFLQGPGGIGKSKLLEECIKQAAPDSERYAVASRVYDLYETTNRDLTHLIELMTSDIFSAAQLGETYFQTYYASKKAYDDARNSPDASPQGIELKRQELIKAFREGLKLIAETKPVVLAFDTFEHIQNTPSGEWLLGQNPEGLRIPGVICLFASRTPLSTNSSNSSHIDYQVVGKLEDEEAKTFLQQYIERQERNKPHLPDDKDIKILNRLAGGNPLILTLALESGLGANKAADLTDEDFERACIEWANPHSQVIQTIDRKQIDHPFRQALMCAAFLNRRFNSNFIVRLKKTGYIDEPFNGDLFIEDPPAFFIKSRTNSGESQLHDIVAEWIRKYYLLEFFGNSEERVKGFYRNVLKWHDELINEEADVTKKNALRVEKLAYLLVLEAQADSFTSSPGLSKEFLKIVSPSIEEGRNLISEYQSLKSSGLNRLILNEFIENGSLRNGILDAFTFENQFLFLSLLGNIGRGSYLLEEAQVVWNEAINVANASGNPRLQAEGLFGLSGSLWQRDKKLALQKLDYVLNICLKNDAAYKMLPAIHHRIGFINRQKQDIETAIASYKEARKQCLTITPSDQTLLATIENDLGYASYLRGYRKQGITYVKRGKDVREVLLSKLDNSERQMDVGRSYNTLGELSRYEGAFLEAINYYNQSLQIFETLGSYEWQVKALTGRGEANRLRALQLKEKERQSFMDSARGDIRASINLCEKYSIIHEYPTTYRRQGRLIHDEANQKILGNSNEALKLLDEAQVWFEKGERFALETGNDLEELHCLKELAFLADDRATILQSSDPKLSEAIRLFEKKINENPPVFELPIFVSLLAIENGAFHYSTGDFDSALNLYKKGFIALASDPGYGSSCCEQYIPHLKRQILNLPPDLANNWCHSFIHEWRKRDEGSNLIPDDLHPDFSMWCEDQVVF